MTSPPCSPAPGADVDHPVGAAYRVLVVFDDNQRVAEIAQVVQGFDEAFVVTLVQADTRLVQYIEHIHQLRAYLRSQADTLALSTGQADGAAVQRQIIQTDIEQNLSRVRISFKISPAICCCLLLRCGSTFASQSYSSLMSIVDNS